MATVPTSRMETELRKLFLQWSAGLPNQTGRMDQYLDKFRRDSLSLINKMGGDISRLGVSAGFPAPKELDLDLVAGHIYDQMQLAVVRAQIMTGLNARESASALLKAGVGTEFYKLERLARTETVRAYWKNQWDEGEDLGLVMLWGAESGPRTCEWCLERDGMVVPSRLVRDHPNGRCTLVPTLPSRVEYKGSVAGDGSIFYDPEWDVGFRSDSPEIRQIEPFTEHELSVMEEYQKGRYDLVNASLRNGEYNSEVSELIQGLDDMMSKSVLPDTTVVTRRQTPEGFFTEVGIELKPGSVEARFPGLPPEAAETIYQVAKSQGMTTDWGDWDTDALVGRKWYQKAFLSTSEGEVPGSFTGNVEMKITVPEGTHALRMGNAYEQEILLDRGLTYEITEAKWNPLRNIMEVSLRVVKR